jgi:hypothetical protein
MVLVSIGFALLLPERVRIADAAKDTTLAVYNEAVASQLPGNALLWAKTDSEGFMGFDTPTGHVPALLPGLMVLDWYRLGTVRRLHPFLQPPKHWSAGSLNQLIYMAFDAGIPVYSTDYLYFTQSKTDHTHRTGLYFVRSPKASGYFDATSARSVIELCPFVERLPESPPETHWLSLGLMGDFSSAYSDLTGYFHENHIDDAARISFRIAGALEAGNPGGSAAASCRELEEWNVHAHF